jgi:N-acetylneuraminic acid mutarotase
MPTARSEIAGAVLNDKIYIVGGFDNTGRSTSNVEVYNHVTGRWVQSISLPQSLDHAAATSFNGKLYVVGGGY